MFELCIAHLLLTEEYWYKVCIQFIDIFAYKRKLQNTKQQYSEVTGRTVS